jgi:hypothetical protein
MQPTRTSVLQGREHVSSLGQSSPEQTATDYSDQLVLISAATPSPPASISTILMPRTLICRG